jgi:hypothetical protein
MRLVIAFVPNMLRPQVKQLGESLHAEFADVSGSDLAYGQLVARMWLKRHADPDVGESFLLLEHDVVAGPELLRAMWDCPEPWCHAFAWRFSGPVAPGETKPQHPIRQRETALFCHRFSADLIRQTPHVPSAMRVRWTGVDLALLPMLSAIAEPHLHGPVIHLHQNHPQWALAMTEDDWSHVDA